MWVLFGGVMVTFTGVGIFVVTRGKSGNCAAPVRSIARGILRPLVDLIDGARVLLSPVDVAMDAVGDRLLGLCRFRISEYFEATDPVPDDRKGFFTFGSKDSNLDCFIAVIVSLNTCSYVLTLADKSTFPFDGSKNTLSTCGMFLFRTKVRVFPLWFFSVSYCLRVATLVITMVLCWNFQVLYDSRMS